MVVLIVHAVDVGAGVEQQVEQVPPPGFDRDVKGLRPAAPERMRAYGVDHVGRGREDSADLVDAAGADEPQERLDHVVAGELRRSRRLTRWRLAFAFLDVPLELSPALEAVVARDRKLGVGQPNGRVARAKLLHARSAPCLAVFLSHSRLGRAGSDSGIGHLLSHAPGVRVSRAERR